MNWGATRFAGQAVEAAGAMLRNDLQRDPDVLGLNRLDRTRCSLCSVTVVGMDRHLLASHSGSHPPQLRREFRSRLYSNRVRHHRCGARRSFLRILLQRPASRTTWSRWKKTMRAGCSTCVFAERCIAVLECRTGLFRRYPLPMRFLSVPLDEDRRRNLNSPDRRDADHRDLSFCAARDN